METVKKSITMLCRHPIFYGMDEEMLAEILKQNHACIKSCKAGEIILSPQAEQKKVGMVLFGKAIVSTPDKTKNVLLRYLNAGDLFGIANLFTKEPYVSLIRASGSCKVLSIPESAIRYLIENDKAFLYRYLEFLSGRICFLNQKIGYLTAGSTERRLALYFISLGENPVKLPLSISSLSEILDVGRASLYRAFDRLTSDGFLIKEGRVFHLSDPEAMLRSYH